MSGTWQRIWAMVLRHSYLLRSSWPRLLELAYWPTFQLLLWGFITTFFLQHSSWIAQAAGVLISAVLLWDVLFRVNLGLALTFLEEMWARNLGQLFISPLRPSELIASLMFISLIRTLISVTPAAFLALPLFDVWVFDLGLGLAAFFLQPDGYGLGHRSPRLGPTSQTGPRRRVCAGLASFSSRQSPVFITRWRYCLTGLSQSPGHYPSTYVFEGMRSVLFDQVFRWDLLAGAVCLNLLYLLLCSGVFLWMFRVARYQGKLLQQGE